MREGLDAPVRFLGSLDLVPALQRIVQIGEGLTLAGVGNPDHQAGQIGAVEFTVFAKDNDLGIVG